MGSENQLTLEDIIKKKEQLTRAEVEAGVALIEIQVKALRNSFYLDREAPILLQAIESIKQREKLALLNSTFSSSKLRHLKCLETLKSLKQNIEAIQKRQKKKAKALLHEKEKQRTEARFDSMARALTGLLENQQTMWWYMDDLTLIQSLSARAMKSESDQDLLDKLLEDKMVNTFRINARRTIEDFRAYFDTELSNIIDMIKYIFETNETVLTWYPEEDIEAFANSLQIELQELKRIQTGILPKISEYLTGISDKEVTPEFIQDTQRLMGELIKLQAKAHEHVSAYKKLLEPLLGEQASDLKDRGIYLFEAKLRPELEQAEHASTSGKAKESADRVRDRLGLFSKGEKEPAAEKKSEAQSAEAIKSHKRSRGS